MLSFKFSSHNAGKACHTWREDYSTKTTNIFQIHLCSRWISTFFGTICCLFSKCNKTLLLYFDTYIMFYLRCKCSKFLDAHTHRNAMKRSIESICLLEGHGRDIYEWSSALTNVIGLLFLANLFKRQQTLTQINYSHLWMVVYIIHKLCMNIIKSIIASFICVTVP